jgi:hypothetical protein
VSCLAFVEWLRENVVRSDADSFGPERLVNGFRNHDERRRLNKKGEAAQQIFPVAVTECGLAQNEPDGFCGSGSKGFAVAVSHGRFDRLVRGRGLSDADVFPVRADD